MIGDLDGPDTFCPVCKIRCYTRENGDRFCGPACAALQIRRDRAEKAGAKPGDREFYSDNPILAAEHRKKMNKRGL